MNTEHLGISRLILSIRKSTRNSLFTNIYVLDAQACKVDINAYLTVLYLLFMPATPHYNESSLSTANPQCLHSAGT